MGSEKIVLITGCRDEIKGKTASETLKPLPGIKGSVSTVQIDVTSPESIENAAKHIESTHGHLDILVNNAGIYSQKQPARDALQDSMAVNVIGAVSTTDAFLPLLRKAASSSSSSSPARIIFVTSSMGSLTHSSDPSSKHFGPYADEYRASKAAVNMVMVQYAGKLGMMGGGGGEMKVFGVDPGFCATNLAGSPDYLRQMGATEPKVGGQIISAVVKGDRDADVGKVCCQDGVVPW